MEDATLMRKNSKFKNLLSYVIVLFFDFFLRFKAGSGGGTSNNVDSIQFKEVICQILKLE